MMQRASKGVSKTVEDERERARAIMGELEEHFGDQRMTLHVNKSGQYEMPQVKTSFMFSLILFCLICYRASEDGQAHVQMPSLL